jgi:hypothetical protein
MNLWKNRLYMKPVLTKEWQTDKLTYQADIAKAQSAQRDKGIKTYHTMHVNSYVKGFAAFIIFALGHMITFMKCKRMIQCKTIGDRQHSFKNFHLT